MPPYGLAEPKPQGRVGLRPLQAAGKGLGGLEFTPLWGALKLDYDLESSQYGVCPICNEELFNGENLHRHHIIPKKDGGKFVFSNLSLLHLPCHYKIHSNDKETWQQYLIDYKKNHPRFWLRHPVKILQITRNSKSGTRIR